MPGYFAKRSNVCVEGPFLGLAAQSHICQIMSYERNRTSVSAAAVAAVMCRFAQGDQPQIPAAAAKVY